MKTNLRTRLRFTEGLGFRLVFLLTVALLPLGIIAVAQTWHIFNQTERISRVALQGKTAEAAAGERTLIQTALGAGEALSQAVMETLPDRAACERMLEDYTSASAFVFVGFADAGGRLACASNGAEQDFSGNRTFLAMRDNPVPRVTASEHGALSGLPVVVVWQPVMADGELDGVMAFSIAQARLEAIRSFGAGDEAPAEIATFNAEGALLTTSDATPLAQQRLPANHTLADLAVDREQTFGDVTVGGERRIFSVVPVVPGLVYALGSWMPGHAPLAPALISPLLLLLIPLAMWLTSLAVAYLAVYRLVIRHVRALRGQMRRFALGERAAPPEVLEEAPAEIQDVSQTFHNLARILIRDEEQMEASVREKTILLREVHHRVKNNLQLIASIVNMQIRRVRDPLTRRVLRSVQDRVSSLASIHRNLYQAQSVAAVRADRLIADIVNQLSVLSAEPGGQIAIDTDFDPVTLFPDQAVPLTLLAAEGVTNAVKYAAPPEEGGRPWLRVSLKRDGERGAFLEIVNSVGAGAPAAPAAEVESGGLGSQLIAAFASQLDATAEQVVEDGVHRLTVRFPFAPFESVRPPGAPRQPS